MWWPFYNVCKGRLTMWYTCHSYNIVCQVFFKKERKCQLSLIVTRWDETRGRKSCRKKEGGGGQVGRGWEGRKTGKGMKGWRAVGGTMAYCGGKMEWPCCGVRMGTGGGFRQPRFKSLLSHSIIWSCASYLRAVILALFILFYFITTSWDFWEDKANEITSIKFLD